MSRLIHIWFSWPDGAVLTNLVASAIWVSFAAWKLVKRFNQIHSHLDDVHARVRLVHDQVTKVHEHQLANAPKRRTVTRPGEK